MTLANLEGVLYTVEWSCFVFLIIFPLHPLLEIWGQERTALVVKVMLALMIASGGAGMIISFVLHDWWGFASFLFPIMIIVSFFEDQWRNRGKRSAKELGDKAKILRAKLVRTLRDLQRRPVPIPVPARN